MQNEGDNEEMRRSLHGVTRHEDNGVHRPRPRRPPHESNDKMHKYHRKVLRFPVGGTRRSQDIQHPQHPDHLYHHQVQQQGEDDHKRDSVRITHDNQGSHESESEEACGSYNISINSDEETTSYDENKTERTAFNWRMSICFLSIVLLWSTTLNLARSIISTTTTVPTFEDVYRTCEFAYDEMITQRKWYEECAQNQLNKCIETRDESLDKAVNYLTIAKQRNKNVKKQLQEIQLTCAEVVENILSELRDVSVTSSSHSNNIVFEQGDTCTSENKEQLQSLIGDKTTSSDAFTDSTEFVARSQKTVTSLADYATRLNQYNKEYLANKTMLINTSMTANINFISKKHFDMFNSSLDTLINNVENLVTCISLNATNSDEASHCEGFPATINELYNQMKLSVSKSKKKLLHSVDTMKFLIEDGNDYISEAISNMNAFYDTVARAGGVMTWINDNLVSLSPVPVSLCDVGSSPSWCSFHPSMWYVSPTMIPFVPDLMDVPSSESLWNQVDEAVTNAAVNNREIVGDVLSSGEMWNNDLLEMLHGSGLLLLDDYDPPKFGEENDTDTGMTVESYDQMSTKYLNSVGNHLTNLSAPPISNDYVPSLNNTNFDELLLTADAVLSDHSYTFEEITFLEDMDLLKVVQSFGDISALLILLDTLFRVIQTVRLLRNHWDKSSVSLPTVNMSNSSWGDKYKSWCSKSLALFGHVWVTFLVALVILIIVIIKITSKVLSETYDLTYVNVFIYFLKVCTHLQ